MGRQSRKYNPRTRTKRPIGLQVNTEQSPSKPHPMPSKLDDRWFLPNPLGARLNQKSGLGLNVENGISLEAIEVLFCHWNRHVHQQPFFLHYVFFLMYLDQEEK